MHIEPGFVTPAKVLMANAGALTVVAWAAKDHLKSLSELPWMAAKTVLAAAFFTVFMQSFHMPVGPSELHFVGAMAIYLTLGFLPTLLGFGLGLAVQGALFAPADLVHLGVNALSLMAPLVAVHYAGGRRMFDGGRAPRVSWSNIVKLDAAYYSGVTAMVGFWLWFGGEQTAFADWLAFAASYAAVVAVEPFVTLAAVKALKAAEGQGWVRRLFTTGALNTAN
ncbi:MAG: energy-coupling factor ABC transporter permease [Alphaproteobacteria bacterium]|nr:energy-coupling factor ABC transporter permease [Alphaproteobacteria bacterium]